jgi:hypothetical protein
MDSHVEVAGHSSSVPSSLVRQQLAARVSAQVGEICHTGPRVASHQRSPHQGRHSTVVAHRPRAPRDSAEWPPQRLVRWAATTGAATAPGGETILASRPQPQQGFRACLGRMRRGKRSGAGRREAACQRAVTRGACAYKRLESLRKHALDRQPWPGKRAAAPALPQGHSRGAQYSRKQRGDPCCYATRRWPHCRPSHAPAWCKPSARRWRGQQAQPAVAQHAAACGSTGSARSVRTGGSPPACATPHSARRPVAQTAILAIPAGSTRPG